MASDGDLLLAHVRRELDHAEWHDKRIYVVQGEDFQAWWMTLYLPVYLSDPDKSPEHGLETLLKQLRAAEQSKGST